MLYELFTPLKEYYSPFNLFEYITFRAATAAIVALILSFLIGPRIIHILHTHQIGEEIRPTGPESHMKKKGTPTMGGVIIILASLLPTLMFSNLENTMIPEGHNLRHDRKRLSAKLSFDDAKTWPVNKVIEEGPSGYSDVAQLRSGEFICIYECEIVERICDDKYIRVTKFDKNWLTS